MILVERGTNFKFQQQLYDGKENRFIKLEVVESIIEQLTEVVDAGDGSTV